MKSQLSPFNRQNGGHSDLEGEKLVYNSFFLVYECALKVSQREGGDVVLGDLATCQDLGKSLNRRKFYTPPLFFEMRPYHPELILKVYIPVFRPPGHYIDGLALF